MKKIMCFAAALLLLAGCRGSQETRENTPAEVGTITGTIELPKGPNRIVAPDGWKAMTDFRMKWESTDKIYIYNQTECKELTVTSIDAQTGSATFTGELLTDMSDYKVAYGYHPKNAETAFAVDNIDGNYRPFAWGTGEYKVFTINNFGPVMGFKLLGSAGVDKIEVIVSRSGAAKATYTMTLSNAIALNTETEKKVYFPLNDLGDADKLEANFYNGSILCKTQKFVTLPVKNMVTTYPTIEGINIPPTPVDLGLSVKWATFNVGATKPEEYGDYFAWGETAPYYTGLTIIPGKKISAAGWKEGKESGYAWESYFDRSGGVFTKYNNKGGKTVLEPEDDAARKNWGSDWRMPTKEEWTELINNCHWEWYDGSEKKYNNTIVKGYLGTSKVQGNNDSIFLPAAGGLSAKDPVYLDLSLDGKYWSASLHDYSQDDQAHVAQFNKSIGWGISGNFNTRYYGFLVRPVYCGE